MRNLAILTFQSLDGVVQAPKLPEEDRSGGFSAGGWADPYWDEVMNLVGKEAMAVPYDVLFGRNTYDMFAAHATDDHPLNTLTKYVVTSRAEPLGWDNSIPVGDDIAVEIQRLKEQDGPLLQVHGSWQLIQLLLAYDLIDELRLFTFPVVLGEGKRLFGNDALAADFTLKKTAHTPNGVVMGCYQRIARTPDAGSNAID